MHIYNEDQFDDEDEYSEWLHRDTPKFANPGSALRCATRSNPRTLPCPTCGQDDRLTPEDVAEGYQCDTCADMAERGGDY